MLNFILKYLRFVPKKVINILQVKKNKFIKSNTIFGIFEYTFEFESEQLEDFILPFLLNISQIIKEITKLIVEKKIVSIFSVITLHTFEGQEFEHKLEDSQNLYNLSNIDQWPRKILTGLIKKLDTYSSFTKISFNISVRALKKK